MDTIPGSGSVCRGVRWLACRSACGLRCEFGHLENGPREHGAYFLGEVVPGVRHLMVDTRTGERAALGVPSVAGKLP
jgi:hypothetical protein